MRTHLAEFDLAKPQPVWGLRGYGTLWVLVRHGPQPLGLVKLPLAGGEQVLTPARLAAAVSRQLGPLPPPPAPPPAACPAITVVVCTRDRPVALRRCLAALQRLDYPNYEVLVVDNASRGPATRQIVAGTPFRYLREERPGLDWARNAGWRSARTDLVAYVDDDAVADPHWLRGLAGAFADTRVMAVTGLVLPAELETEAQHLFERYGGMGKGFAPRTFDFAALAPAERVGAHAAGVGANMAFRRAALERLDGFDTALDVGTPARGAGDIDMFFRLLAAGLRLRYEPAALVWHRHRRSFGALRRQLADNGCSFGVYLLKVWRTRSLPGGALWPAVRWWAGDWLAGRMVRRLLGCEPLPLSLLAAELGGALYAPVAYYRTYRAARARRAHTPA